MLRHFTPEYWQDDGWYVRKLLEIPGAFSQGETIEELQENIKEVYQLLLEDETTLPHPGSKTMEIEVAV